MVALLRVRVRLPALKRCAHGHVQQIHKALVQWLCILGRCQVDSV